MTSLLVDSETAAAFITGFEMAHGRSPSHAEVADGVFDGDDARADRAVKWLIIDGRVRVGFRSRRRKLQMIKPVPVPRAADGEPLYFVKIGGA